MARKASKQLKDARKQAGIAAKGVAQAGKKAAEVARATVKEVAKTRDAKTAKKQVKVAGRAVKSAAAAAGGTLGGISRFLRRQTNDRGQPVHVTLADPQGSSLYHWLRHGELKATGPGSITEGIGIGRVTANLHGAPIDDALHVTDVECVRAVYQLLRAEGLFLGSTSGVNVAAAVQVAKRLGPGHTIVTILCDNGAKYQSRLFNRKWLAEKGLLEAAGLAQSQTQVLQPAITETPGVVDGYPQRLSA